MNNIAERYVKLVLLFGQYDEDCVDAYYGPEEWKPSSEILKQEPAVPSEKIKNEIESLRTLLARCTPNDAEDIWRKRTMEKQLTAFSARFEFVLGKKFPFDVESSLLYDAVAPHRPESFYSDLLKNLDTQLPGSGVVSNRVNSFRSSFIIPKDNLDAVFQSAIAEGRRRTLEKISLPTEEKFIIEYVSNKPWSGYNWYKGETTSIIQINTDLPIFIDRAVDLACHEGYPGHHLFNARIESQLVRRRGWIEFFIYPLFSPLSLVAEGAANFGIEMAFPGAERTDFERSVLFPLAGLDASRTEEYYAVHSLTTQLSYAGNEAAQQYLDGAMSKQNAVDWLVTYGLYSPDRAEQRIRFIERYRSYVINYNLGLDIVRRYIEKSGGTEQNEKRRWEVFNELMSMPETASVLTGEA